MLLDLLLLHACPRMPSCTVIYPKSSPAQVLVQTPAKSFAAHSQYKRVICEVESQPADLSLVSYLNPQTVSKAPVRQLTALPECAITLQQETLQQTLEQGCCHYATCQDCVVNPNILKALMPAAHKVPVTVTGQHAACIARIAGRLKVHAAAS